MVDAVYTPAQSRFTARMNKNEHHARVHTSAHFKSSLHAFTLIELLIVISVMVILASTGAPALLKASRIMGMKNNMNVVKAMLDDTRAKAINGHLMSNAPSSVDTNYDGIAGDDLPFAYVFEVNNGTNGMTTLREYADFTDNGINGISLSDILIKQKTYTAGQLVFTYAGYPDINIPNIGVTGASLNRTYRLAYSPLTGTPLITCAIDTSSNRCWSAAANNNIDLLTIGMRNQNVSSNVYSINVFDTSGAPYTY